MIHRSTARAFPLALLLCLAPRAAAQDAQDARGDLQRLDLPDEPGVELSLPIRIEGVDDRLDLRRHSLRADDARVRVFVRDQDGERYEHVEAPPVRTYRGVLASSPATVVLGSFTARGFEAEIESVDGPGWTVRPARDGYYEVARRRHDHAAFPAACGVAEAPAPAPQSNPKKPLVPGASFCRLQRAEIAFDADYEYFGLHGSSTANVIAQIEAHMNLVDYFYARDVLITYAITGYVIRTVPFYTPTNGGELLDQFRAEWNANQGAIPRDIGHLMTAKPGALIQYGGLAWVGVVCTSSAYGWSLDSAGIIGHEVGHNWGAGHCLDPSPCNNMCGACLSVAPNTKNVILAHRNSRTCLEPAPAYPTPLPPYAHPESRTFTKAKYGAIPPARFDVLANDHDGNCDGLLLADHDKESANGGRVETVIGARGALELQYTFPSEPFVGADTFGYTVLDTSGMTSEGTVTIDVRSPGVEAYWSFDDQAGTTVVDSSGNGYDAVAQQAVEWVFPGIANGAMRFNGVDQLLDTNTKDFSAPWSVSAWIGRKPTPGAASALAESSDGSLRTEQWNNTTEAGVTKYGSGDASFGHTLALHTFKHVVWVGTKASTALWVDGAYIGEVPVAIRAPMAPASRANDPLAAVVDDLRVHNHALTAAEIQDLYLRGGGAVAPAPRDGAKKGVGSTPLTWVAGLAADSHDVYFGTDWKAVRDAQFGAPEHLGTFVANSAPAGPLLADTTYYWRVDTNVGAEVIGGPLWQFRLSDRWQWRLDELAGTTAAQETGGQNATYLGGALLGQPGATPSTGTSVRLDGSNDTVRISALDLHTDAATFTMWLRRDGAQADFRGLMFCRDGDTTAGMNLSTGHQLGYHWNGDSATWSWNSGLVVPDSTWVFAALVVAPGKATLYLGDGGALASAENLVSHGIEEFNGVTELGLDSCCGRYFRGWIDDARVYGEALTSSEIDAIYQASL